MKKILDVPYYSQILDVEEDYWKKSGCGIVSIKMIIDYFYKDTDFETPKLSKLFDEGIFIKGFINGYWVHKSLTSLIRNYGVSSYNQEFRSRSMNYENEDMFVNEHENTFSENALNKICEQIKNNNPVIVSIFRNVNEQKGGHLIVLTGYEKRNKNIVGFFYNEPNSESIEQGKNIFVSKDIFLEMWKKFAIFVYK
ncbi:MAG: hypothetical protein Athens071416_100 [Parcubacteria group bacterium Athens0714_16]|nr:MAG: hypothetical protein Athens071416_100 [Parcubacteria group bacterium Athens0714_16]